jgi:hypothetical protein
MLQEKANQRVIHIDSSNAEIELDKLANGHLKFGSTADINDAWIFIGLDSVLHEENLAKQIQRILGKFYKRIANAEIKPHCGSILYQSTDSQDRADNVLNMSLVPLRRAKGDIPNRESKIGAIIDTITSRISDFSLLYRSGPSLYFYRRIIELRKKRQQISDFISDNYSLEILYATLVSWDMNSRGAKLKYFDDFRKSILSCLPELEAIEHAMRSRGSLPENKILGLLKSAFFSMALMQTSSRLVSNSKCLHFLFPSLCMPMDRTNTLMYFFGNTNESVNRYLTIVSFSFDIIRQPVEFEKYLDNCWNQSVPKLIDNAIILLRGKSIRNLYGP